jgi:hypothetical protein
LADNRPRSIAAGRPKPLKDNGIKPPGKIPASAHAQSNANEQHRTAPLRRLLAGFEFQEKTPCKEPI